MKTFDDMLEDPYWRIAADLIDTVLKVSEKAHPVLPDSVEEIVNSGLGRTKQWVKLYYLDEKTCRKLWDARVKDWMDYYEKLWTAWEELDSIYEPEPAYTPEIVKKISPWLYLFYTPTSCRSCFEEMKEKLKDCKTLDDVLEKLGVQKIESDL